MIAHGAPVVFSDDGYTVLHAAIEHDRSDKHAMIKLLIAAGADINAHGVNDWAPAHRAAVSQSGIARNAGCRHPPSLHRQST